MEKRRPYYCTECSDRGRVCYIQDRTNPMSKTTIYQREIVQGGREETFMSEGYPCSFYREVIIKEVN